jgi:hypothetical protein
MLVPVFSYCTSLAAKVSEIADTAKKLPPFL